MKELERLQKWYFSQCDGDWEHYQGVSIENIDNPGWMVNIDLSDTELDAKEFELLRSIRTEENWILCRVEDNTFKGDGGPFNLVEILNVFLTWAEVDCVEQA